MFLFFEIVNIFHSFPHFNMSAPSVHHVGIGVLDEKPMLKLFQEQLKFELISKRQTCFDSKWVLKNHTTVFVITKPVTRPVTTTTSSSGSDEEEGGTVLVRNCPHDCCVSHCCYSTSLQQSQNCEKQSLNTSAESNSSGTVQPKLSLATVPSGDTTTTTTFLETKKSCIHQRLSKFRCHCGGDKVVSEFYDTNADRGTTDDEVVNEKICDDYSCTTTTTTSSTCCSRYVAGQLEDTPLPHFSSFWGQPEQQQQYSTFKLGSHCSCSLNNNSVYEVCLNVADVRFSLQKAIDCGATIVRPLTVVASKEGEVTYATIRSCVGNIQHTIINTDNYAGRFLPGFEDCLNTSPNEESGLYGNISLDHIALAVSPHKTLESIAWYKNCFGMHRLIVNR